MRRLDSLDEKESLRWRYYQEELFEKFKREGLPEEQARQRAREVTSQQAGLYEEERTKSFKKNQELKGKRTG